MHSPINTMLIESSSQMEVLLESLSNEKLIAIDTEFFRETTYYPELALVQVATDSIVACIDPLAFDAKPALKELLLDESVIKVFHSCSQDLEVLFYYLGEIPNNIYDTQIANALLSDHHQIGYAALVENELAIQLDKSQTRTNWLQRPLTKAQIQYAGDDVLYLYQLHKKLNEKLQPLNRKIWLDEECQQLSNNNNDFQVDINKLWRRVKGSTKLNRNKLAIVQAIAQWREQLAQTRNKTRRKILSDDLVVKLALNTLIDTNTLNQTIAYQCKLNDDELQNLFHIIESAQHIPEEQWPDNRFSALEPQQKSLLKELQQLVNNKAETLGISSAIICSKKDLESLILNNATDCYLSNNKKTVELNILQGWRLPCIGESLLEILKKQENLDEKTVVNIEQA